MASIWMQVAGQAPEKLDGNLPHVAAVGLFKSRIAKLQKKNPTAKLTYSDDMLALFSWPDGGRFHLYVELMSPPSAPEKCQPKIRKGKGMLVDAHGDLHDLPLPRWPRDPEKAE